MTARTSTLLRGPVAFAAPADRIRRYLVVIAWVAIVLGIVFRLTQLPTRAVYFDEAYTQMRVAGSTELAMWQTVYDGKQRTAQALRHDSTVDASSSAGRLVASLVQEDSQHPPLFYLAELLIVKAFGNSLLIWRLLPAIFGILAIGAAYALARELFADAGIALVSAAAFAVSPIERIYSEQAREYSLLVLLVLLATLALIRAVRESNVRAWTLYALALVAGLYTSPFMGYIVVAHAVFALVPKHAARRSVIFGFAGAAIVAFAAYAPWLLAIFTHRDAIAKTNDWSAERWPLSRLVVKWVFNTGASYFDLEYINLRWSIVLAAVSVFAGFAFVRGLRTSGVQARWCLGAAIAVPAMLLIAPDIILGEHRSSVARYALPALAFIPIVIGRGLAWRPIAASVVLAAGLCSSAVGLLHNSWWDNDRNGDDAAIAAIVNASPRAQVVSDIPPGSVIAFTRLFHDDVRVSLSGDLKNAQFSAADPIFVLWPKTSDLRAFEKQTGIAFVRVPFQRTLTAHEIGTHIGSGTAKDDRTADLFVGSRPSDTSAPRPGTR